LEYLPERVPLVTNPAFKIKTSRIIYDHKWTLPSLGLAVSDAFILTPRAISVVHRPKTVLLAEVHITRPLTHHGQSNSFAVQMSASCNRFPYTIVRHTTATGTQSGSQIDQEVDFVGLLLTTLGVTPWLLMKMAPSRRVKMMSAHLVSRLVPRANDRVRQNQPRK
jgi:hypothetical protein